MQMINCNREAYTEALARAEGWTWQTNPRTVSPADLQVLQTAAQGLFNYVENGRWIQPKTWLCVQRAHMRGKVAISRLIRSKKVADGDRRTKRVAVTADEYAAALKRQGEVLELLRQKAPTFFEGTLVADDPPAQRPSEPSALAV